MSSIIPIPRLRLMPSVHAGVLMLLSLSALSQPNSTAATESPDALPPIQCADSTLSRGTGCLTRSAAYWAKNPDRIAVYLDPPLDVCGQSLGSIGVGSSDSAIEALCSTGADGGNLGQPLAQLIRQCTAATLNVTASAFLGGNCSLDFPRIEAEMIACCGHESVCAGHSVDGWEVESCVTVLDLFNNFQYKTLSFASQEEGPSDPTLCRAAADNGITVLPAP